MDKMKWLRKPLSPRERISILKAEKKKIDKEIKRWYNKEEMGEKKMNEVLRNNFDEMSLEELSSFRKEFSDYVRERKEESVIKSKDSFMKLDIPIGTRISFMLKGKSVEGVLAKVNEHTFTVQVVNRLGQVLNKPIRFNMFLGRISKEEIA